MAFSVSDRTMLWGRVGTIFADTPATAEEAITKGGLDWEVELRKMGYKNSKGNYSVAPGQWAVVRTDEDALLGVVKSRYKPFQNREAFAFCDHLVDDYGAKYECAFSTNGGRVVGLTMKLPETVTIGGEDAFGKYLMLRTSHDGLSSINVAVHMVRMACLNQFDASIRGARHRYAISHTAKADQQLQQAREALQIAFRYEDAFEAAMEQLLQTPLGTKEAESKRITNILEGRRCGERACNTALTAIWLNLETSPTIPDAYRNTAYGLLNSVTEVWEHKREHRSGQSAFLTNTEGIGYHLRDRLTNEMLVG